MPAAMPGKMQLRRLGYFVAAAEDLSFVVRRSLSAPALGAPATSKPLKDYIRIVRDLSRNE